MTEQHWLAEVKKRADWLRVSMTREVPDPNEIRRDRALLIGDIMCYWQVRNPDHMDTHYADRQAQLRGMDNTELLNFAR